MTVFARGLLDRLVTRLYFPDEPAANAADPVLAVHRRRPAGHADRPGPSPSEPADPGDPSGPGTVLRFDIRLQGDGETVFFDV